MLFEIDHLSGEFLLREVDLVDYVGAGLPAGYVESARMTSYPASPTFLQLELVPGRKKGIAAPSSAQAF